MAQEERRLAAIMFSDICGYSKLMGRDEAQAMRAVDFHNRTVASWAERMGGRVIKTMGDGILTEFPSAVNAVECGVHIQRSIRDHDEDPLLQVNFQVRIGIHLGDVVVVGDDILGDGVNVASRIEPFAEPGGICISRDIFNLVKNNVEIQTVHLGARDLKNIDQKVEVYKIIIDALTRQSLSGPVAPRKRGLGKRLVIIAALLVVLLVVAARIRRQRLSARRRQSVTGGAAAQLSQTSTPVGLVVKAGKKPPAAVSAPAGKPGDGGGKRAAARAAVEKRHEAMWQAVRNKRWADLVAFVAPGLRQGRKSQALERSLARMFQLRRAQGVMADSVGLQRVEIRPDGRGATVIGTVMRREGDAALKQEFKEDWALVDGEWYLRPRRPMQRFKAFTDRGGRDKRRAGAARRTP